MSINLEKNIIKEISDIGKMYDVRKIILFGSRARGTNFPKSDIDIAVAGCKDFDNFYFDISENVNTLLKFDIINLENENISKALLNEIERDGVTIYEKI